MKRNKWMLDRFDGIMVLVILVLSTSLGLVIASGDHISKARQSAARIVYLGSSDGITQNLYVVDPATPDKPQPITASDNGIVAYDVSPDGNKIVYSEVIRADLPSWGVTRLYLWDATTRQASLLYECQEAVCNSLAWRPDGKVIAFERIDVNPTMNAGASPPRVWLFDLVQNVAAPLFRDNQQLSQMPRWSPDSTRLAVVSATAKGIIIHDFSTTKDKVIPTPEGEIGQFSPDGKWLSYPKIVSVSDGGYAVHQILVDTTSDTLVQRELVPPTEPVSDGQAIWQADSQSLIIARQPATHKLTQGPQLYSLDLATGQATLLLAEDTYSLINISLNPAGDTLVFLRTALDTTPVHPELWTYNLHTHELKRITQNVAFPRWLP